MASTVLWVGFVTALVAFLVDAILWTSVFGKGMDYFVSKEQAQAPMPKFMLLQFFNTVLFGLAFTYLYTLVIKGISLTGLMAGMLYGALLWLPTILPAGLANLIWWDKVRRLSRANILANLIKFVISGAVVGLLV